MPLHMPPTLLESLPYNQTQGEAHGAFIQVPTRGVQ
jgi:hypothetical protein